MLNLCIQLASLMLTTTHFFFFIKSIEIDLITSWMNYANELRRAPDDFSLWHDITHATFTSPSFLNAIDQLDLGGPFFSFSTRARSERDSIYDFNYGTTEARLTRSAAKREAIK
jgi:hypothetical protein